MDEPQYDQLWDSLPKNDIGRVGLREFKQLASSDGSVLAADEVLSVPAHGDKPPGAGAKDSVPHDTAVEATTDTLDVAQVLVPKVLAHFGTVDKAIQSLVLDDKGDFSGSQLKILLKCCGCSLSPQQLKELLAALDKKGTGNINAAAFKQKVCLLFYLLRLLFDEL